jgi:hypothetical protein
VVRRAPLTRAVAARMMTPRVGGATITRVVARSIAAWAGARAVTLWGGAGVTPRTMLIAGQGTRGPGSARA